MLTIRTAQMHDFRQEAVRGFINRVVARIALTYPDAYARMGQAGAAALVERAIELGARNAIQTEGCVSALVDLMVQVGEQFERSPQAAWARGVLANPTMPEQLKINTLVARIVAWTQGRVVEPA